MSLEWKLFEVFTVEGVVLCRAKDQSTVRFNHTSQGVHDVHYQLVKRDILFAEMLSGVYCIYWYDSTKRFSLGAWLKDHQ
jgi:hypothetical protein